MKIKNILVAVMIAVSTLFVVAPVYADDADTEKCVGGTNLGDGKCNKICSDDNISIEQKNAAGCDMTDAKEDMVPTHITNIINVAISVIGIIAVLVIAFAGQRYVVSGGDSAKVKAAKDMIVYAVVAIVVAVLSWAIINYIVGAIGK